MWNHHFWLKENILEVNLLVTPLKIFHEKLDGNKNPIKNPLPSGNLTQLWNITIYI